MERGRAVRDYQGKERKMPRKQPRNLSKMCLSVSYNLTRTQKAPTFKADSRMSTTMGNDELLACAPS